MQDDFTQDALHMADLLVGSFALHVHYNEFCEMKITDQQELSL